MKTFIKKSHLPFLFLLISALLLVAQQGFSQDSKKKQVKVIMKSVNGQTQSKKVIITGNEDGTKHLQVFENGNLTIDKDLAPDESYTHDIDTENLYLDDTIVNGESEIIIKQIETPNEAEDLNEIFDKLDTKLKNADIDLDKIKANIQLEIENSDLDILNSKIDMDELNDIFDTESENLKELLEDIGIDMDDDSNVFRQKTIIVNPLDEENKRIYHIKIDSNLTSDAPLSHPKSEVIIAVRTMKIEDFNENSPLKLKNRLELTDLSFYPNPGNGNFNIKFKNKKSSPIRISIIDIDGKTLYTQEFSMVPKGIFKCNIDSGIREPGTYILKITQGNKSLYKKMIVR